MKIDLELPQNVESIRTVVSAAFENAPHSLQTEVRIVDALRDAGALALSLVASLDDEIAGHVAFSSVEVNGEPGAWYGLGPVSVMPNRQQRGIGAAMILDGLRRLKMMGAEGCVVFGEPHYYGRFGFVCDPLLFYVEAPEGYFLRLSFSSRTPVGEVTYHNAFRTN